MAKKYTIYTRSFIGGILKKTDIQTVEDGSPGENMPTWALGVLIILLVIGFFVSGCARDMYEEITGTGWKAPPECAQVFARVPDVCIEPKYR
jgi:hypothetical protein